jgi:hypothetical protein
MKLSLTFEVERVSNKPHTSDHTRWVNEHERGRRLRPLRLADDEYARPFSPRLQPPLPHLQGLLHRSRHHHLSAYILFTVHPEEFVGRASLSYVSRNKYFRQWATTE